MLDIGIDLCFSVLFLWNSNKSNAISFNDFV